MRHVKFTYRGGAEVFFPVMPNDGGNYKIVTFLSSQNKLRRAIATLVRAGWFVSAFSVRVAGSMYVLCMSEFAHDATVGMTAGYLAAADKRRKPRNRNQPASGRGFSSAYSGR